MPFQPRTYPMVELPQGPSPFQSLSGLMSIANNLGDYQAEQKKRQQQARVEQAFNEAKGDPIKAADIIETKHGDFAMGRTLRDKADDVRRHTLDQVVGRIDEHKTLLGQGGQLLTETQKNPTLWPELRGRVVDLASQLDPRLATEIPEQYDPEKVRGMLQFVEGGITDLTAKDHALKKLKAGYDATDDALKRDKLYRESTAHWLSTAKTPEQWAEGKQYGASMGIPASILNEFGEWSPEAPTRANAMLLTPEQRKADKPTTIQAALLATDLTPARKADLLALQKQLSDAQREPDAVVDPAAIRAVLANPRLWRALNPELRGKMLAPLSKAGFSFPDAVEGMTSTELERLRVYDLRQLDRERRRTDQVTGDRLMSDEVYADEKARIEDFYRELSGEAEPAKIATPPPAAASRGMLAPSTAPAPERRPIPGVPGGEAELRDGRWIRVK